jgi:hypothetical protein
LELLQALWVGVHEAGPTPDQLMVGSSHWDQHSCHDLLHQPLRGIELGLGQVEAHGTRTISSAFTLPVSPAWAEVAMGALWFDLPD